jgi:RNA polymerase sigma factor (sigma-70 family)
MPDQQLGGFWGEFWGEFARRHGAELARCVAVAMLRVGWQPDPFDVDELVQEVYCRVLQRRPPEGLAEWPAARLWGYLYRIAKSVAVDQLRNRYARKRGGVRTRDGEPPAERPRRHVAEHRAAGPSPEDRLLACERAASLRRRVRELGGREHGERNWRILELAAVEGCTAVEISHRLAGDLTPSSVHTVIARLRRQLSPGPQALVAVAG